MKNLQSSLLFLGLHVLPVLANSSSSLAPTATSNGTFTTAIPLALSDYWNLYVGPISTAAINTTVAATPVPSAELIPPPFLDYDSSMPPGRQVPAMVKNQSWSFPKGFWWGVASAAYQVEGAAKDEGRGPCIWDVLSHRVTNYVSKGDTGDVADNEYYLYKQGNIFLLLKSLCSNVMKMWMLGSQWILI